MQTYRKVKKYNNQTGGYKIDIYQKIDNGHAYCCSTDMSKTCKQAVERYLARYPKQTGIYARFDYQLVIR